MKENPTLLIVVAGYLARDEGLFLMQRRPEGKPHAGLWEFPGGKVEKHENPRDALSRELGEELDITVSPEDLTPVGFAEESRERRIVILLYKLANWDGEPRSMEGCEIGWFSHGDATLLPCPPLDIALLEQLDGHKGS